MMSDCFSNFRNQGQRVATPLVSLVIPVFNAERFLSESLRSIASQTFSDFEVIIVDDGSSDNSRQIATDFCNNDSRFTIINNPHGGVSQARNRGIDLAKGKYLGFVDADDCLYPEALAILFKQLEKTKSDVCICGLDKSTEFKPKRIKLKKTLVMDYPTAMKRALYQNLILNSPCGMLIKRELLGSNIRFREHIRYEDLDAFYRFYEGASKIAYLDEKLYFYRQNGGSFMHQWSLARLDALDVTDRIVEYMSERHRELLPAAIDRQFSAHFNILMLMLRKQVNNPEATKRCLNVIRENRSLALRNPNVRLKNKIGAIISFGGLKTLKLFAKLPI